VLQECTSAYAVNDVVNVVDWEATSAAVQAELLGAATRLITDRNLVIWSASLSQKLTMLLDESGFKVEPAPEPWPSSVTRCWYGLLARQGSMAIGFWPAGDCWTSTAGTCECCIPRTDEPAWRAG